MAPWVLLFLISNRILNASGKGTRDVLRSFYHPYIHPKTQLKNIVKLCQTIQTWYASKRSWAKQCDQAALRDFRVVWSAARMLHSHGRKMAMLYLIQQDFESLTTKLRSPPLWWSSQRPSQTLLGTPVSRKTVFLRLERAQPCVWKVCSLANYREK